MHVHHDFEKKRGRPKKKRKKRLTSLKKDFTPTSLREKVSGLIVAGCDAAAAAKGKDTVAILCVSIKKTDQFTLNPLANPPVPTLE